MTLRAISGGLSTDDPMLDRRTPPSDEPAERAIVATAFVDPGLRAQARALLRAEHFFGRQTRTLFEAMNALDADSVPVDAVTLMTYLRETGREGEFAKASPGAIMAGAAAVGNIASYARAVRDAWRMRQLLALAQRLEAEAYGSRGTSAEAERGMSHAPAQQVLEGAVRSFSDLAADAPTFTAQTGQEVMGEAFAYVQAQGQRADRNGTAGVTTGLVALDAKTTGLHGPDLVVLGALASMGKTALLNAIAVGAASAGVGVAFYSLEMPARDVALRAACARAGVSMSEIRSGAPLSPQRSRALVDAMNRIAALPIVWDGLSSRNPSATVPTVVELMAKAERAQATASMRREPPIGLVCVDYLQKIRAVPGRRFQSREETVAQAAAGLKLLAVRLGVPVLVAAALNRESEREGRKPRMRDLRESGATGYDADGVWLLDREDYKHERASSKLPPVFTREAEVIIEKARNGDTGSVILGFDREYTRFRDLPNPGDAPASLFPKGFEP